ncbi:MAG TPA: hypothetical protein VFT74_19240 [Isosphaeraceae bacterium]|nr:hypothetical protein [Isosphaeraceae bacterium]
MTRSTASSPEPNRIIMICTPVGGAERVPPGVETADCSRCHAPVWVSATGRRVCRQAHALPIPLCEPCYARLAPLIERLPEPPL